MAELEVRQMAADLVHASASVHQWFLPLFDRPVICI